MSFEENSPLFSTDKYEHGYLPVYRDIVKNLRGEGRVCELGVFNGGSLMMWQSFFPHGVIVGVDSDETSTWPEGTIKIVSDHTDPKLKDTLADISPEGYDLIVDDGSHIGELAERSFDLFWPLVKPGCWYVIEDWRSAPIIMKDSPESFVERIRQEIGIESIVYTNTGLIVVRKYWP